jgi:uncharacterized protein with HEPN domain
MQRDILLLTGMIDAAEQAHQLTAGITIGQLDTDRQRRDALLWNFTVLGEAAGQLSAKVKDRFPGIPWQQPIRLIQARGSFRATTHMGVGSASAESPFGSPNLVSLTNDL